MKTSTFSLHCNSDLYVECEVLSSLYRRVLNEEKIVDVFISDTIRKNIQPFLSDDETLTNIKLISDASEYSFKTNNSSILIICICPDKFSLLINNDNDYPLSKNNIAKFSSCNGKIRITTDMSKNKEYSIVVFFTETKNNE
ncbi:CRPV-075 [Crowpox virus]|nr:CRPV-075 [Crowpox virus]